MPRSGMVPFNNLHSFIRTQTSGLYGFNMRSKYVTAIKISEGKKRKKKNSYGVWKAACVCLGLKNTLAHSPAFQAGRREHCLTCSFVSRCRSGSGRTARKPGVRPSLSAPPAGRTASGWSAGKRTRSPTSARQSESRSPASKREGNKQKQEY